MVTLDDKQVVKCSRSIADRSNLSAYEVAALMGATRFDDVLEIVDPDPPECERFAMLSVWSWNFESPIECKEDEGYLVRVSIVVGSINLEFDVLIGDDGYSLETVENVTAHERIAGGKSGKPTALPDVDDQDFGNLAAHALSGIRDAIAERSDT